MVEKNLVCLVVLLAVMGLVALVLAVMVQELNFLLALVD